MSERYTIEVDNDAQTVTVTCHESGIEETLPITTADERWEAAGFIGGFSGITYDRKTGKVIT